MHSLTLLLRTLYKQLMRGFFTHCVRLALCSASFFMGACWAQVGTELPVSQSFWLDSTQQMPFEDVQAAAFQSLNSKKRQSFSSGVGWVRLQLEKKVANGAPLLMQIRPPFFSSITVFSASTKEAGRWLRNDIAPESYTKPIQLSLSEPGDTVYVRLQSPADFRVEIIIGTAESLQLMRQKIDVGAAVFITLLLSFLVAIVFQTGFGFSWLKAAMTLFLLFISLAFMLFFGVFQVLTGVGPVVASLLIKIVLFFNSIFLGCVWVLFAKEIFTQSTAVKWVFLWPGFLLALCPLAVYDIDLLITVVEAMHLPGALFHACVLLVCATQYPEALRERSFKFIFLTLLVLDAVICVKGSLLYVDWSAGFKPLMHSNFEIESLQKGIVPFATCLIAFWVLELAKKKRLIHLQSSLLHTQTKLDLEKQLLDRQRKFTAMLSHELKNPLMASHMALGNLHRHMGEDDPSLQSADTIRQSLETIDAIIDRCAEIDAYEQGKIKLILSRFTVGELLSAIKVAHSHHNERIFIITRRLDDALSLSSDMHYLKIILNNLLTNALKYSAPDTLVELLLTLQQEGAQSQLVLSVSNTVGVAGAPDALQVFDRFYRSEGAKQLPGTGQGLWLAQSMAHALGSQIQLKIDADRVTFGFTLAIA